MPRPIAVLLGITLTALLGCQEDPTTGAAPDAARSDAYAPPPRDGGTPSDATPADHSTAPSEDATVDDGPTEPPTIDLASAGFLDVTTYGADPSGRTLSTAALRAAIAAALAEQRVLYFPSGTYLVDDTLELMEPAATNQNTPHDGSFGFVLVGSTGGPRPVIKLVDNCPSFGDDSVPRATVQNGVVTVRPTVKPVVHFFRQQALEDGGSTDPELHDGSRNYNQIIRNIEIDLGSGNKGAVGVRHNGAEGSAIQEVRVIARDGFAGFYSFPSSGGTAIDVAVEGGRYGLYVPFIRGGSPVVVGLRLSGQREQPVFYTGQYPLNIVGFAISQGAGSVFVAKASGNDSSGHLALVDGTIELARDSAPVIDNTDRSIYLSNVFLKGAATLVRSSHDGATLQAPSATTWTRVAEYAYLGGTPTVDAMIDGAVTSTGPRSMTSASSAPTDLLTRHVYPAGLCSFEDPAAVDARDFGAAGDGVTDDTAALRRAIAAADKVLLPKGRYLVSGTLDLRSTTQLCGISAPLSVIAADPAWKTTSPTPIVRTPDDASAQVVLDSIEIATHATENRIHHLHWRAGRASVVKNVIPSARGPWPGNFDIPLARTRITGHGGGRFYGYLQATGWDGMDPGYRVMSIEGTSEPLAFYMYHHQYVKVAGGPMTELRNASNVSFFGQKTENIIPGTEDKHATQFGTPWPILTTISGSSHIRIIGEEGPSQAEQGRGLFEISDSTDVTLVNIGRRGSTSSAYYPETSWYFVKETTAGKTASIDATGLVGLFRRSP